MTIDLKIQESVATVTLARHDRRNSFDTRMLAQMEDVLTTLGRRPEVDIVLLRAEGSVFCGGTDLKELARLDAEATLHWQRRTSELVERWTRLDATTVTAFQGAAVGSGAILGLASDIRIAARECWFQFPEVGYGIPLTWSGVQLLVGMLGADRTKQILLLQERLPSDELLSLGLVKSVVAADRLDEEVDRIVGVLRRAPALGRSMCKRGTSVAASAPGFSANALDPFLASLSIHARGKQDFSWQGSGS